MFFTEIGWFGMVTLLVAYGLVANKRVDSTGLRYNAMNVVGAAAIAYSLIPLQAWPTIALEACFILIGLHAISSKVFTKNTAS